MYTAMNRRRLYFCTVELKSNPWSYKPEHSLQEFDITSYIIVGTVIDYKVQQMFEIKKNITITKAVYVL